MEIHIGIHGSDYYDDTLSKKLDQFRLGRSAQIATNSVRTLADQLRFVKRRQDALVLLENFSGLIRKPYGTNAWTKNLEEFASRISSDAATYFWLTLASQLVTEGRKFDATILMETTSGIADQLYGSNAWSESIEKFRKSLTTINFMNFTGKLCDVLGFAGRAPDAVLLAEYCTGLCDVEYGSESWKKAVRKFNDRVTPSTASAFWQRLSEQLLTIDRASDALRLQEEHLGVWGRKYGSLDWFQKIEQYSSSVSFRDGTAFLVPMGSMLGKAQRPDDAVRLIENYLDICHLQYGTKKWIDKLNSVCEMSTVDNAVILLRVLHEQLVGINRRNDADFVLSYLVHPPRSAAHDLLKNVVVDNSVPVLNHWFRRIGLDGGQFEIFIETAEKTVDYLRRSLSDSGVRVLDRRILITRIKNLRDGIIGGTRSWADRIAKGGGHADLAKELKKKAIIWDLELRQRILSDRLSAQTVYEYSVSKSFMAASSWPFAEEPDASEEPINHLATKAPILASDKLSANVIESDSNRQILGDSFFLNVEGSAFDELTPARLAAYLGTDGVMLHASLKPEGGLGWWLLKPNADASQFDIVNFFSSIFSIGPRIQWLQATHDIRLHFGYLLDETKSVAACSGQLLSLLKRNKNLEVRVLEWASDWEDFLTARLVANSITRQLTSATPTENQVSRLTRDLEKDLKSGHDLSTLLNDITENLVDSLAKLLNIGSIESQLDPQKTDLVISVEGILHNIPWSIIPLKSTRLCQCVRSIRRSLSPHVDGLLKEIESNSQKAVPRPRHVLAVSSLNRHSSPVEHGISTKFHRQIQNAAKKTGHVYLGAAEQPVAEADWLTQQIGCGYYQAVSILAHGNANEKAIELHSSAWDGRGELNRVNWLLLQSCSTGYLEGGLDVEGFCIRLFAYQARSILAPIWDVNALGAPGFSNLVLVEFLKLCADTRETNLPLRAIALNQVRKSLVNDDSFARSQNPVILGGLNTIGAFDIFGLG